MATNTKPIFLEIRLSLPLFFEDLPEDFLPEEGFLPERLLEDLPLDEELPEYSLSLLLISYFPFSFHSPRNLT